MSIGWSETFALDLDLVQKALALNREEPSASNTRAAEVLGIGKPKVRGVNAWMKYLGLRDSHQRTLTPLGELLHQYDTYLTDSGTHCVLHYQLVSNAQAAVWCETVNNFFRERRKFTRQELKEHFISSGISEDSKHLASDIGIFIRMYTDDHRRALQDLGFLRRDLDSVRVGSVIGVPPLVLGYCLYEFLERGLEESTTSVSRLVEESGRLGRAFSLKEDTLRERLAGLEAEGYITVVRSADIDGISYIYDGKALDILRAYYSRST
jgi:hypothetical protein